MCRNGNSAGSAQIIIRGIYQWKYFSFDLEILYYDDISENLVNTLILHLKVTCIFHLYLKIPLYEKYKCCVLILILQFNTYTRITKNHFYCTVKLWKMLENRNLYLVEVKYFLFIHYFLLFVQWHADFEYPSCFGMGRMEVQSGTVRASFRLKYFYETFLNSCAPLKFWNKPRVNYWSRFLDGPIFCARG